MRPPTPLIRPLDTSFLPPFPLPLGKYRGPCWGAGLEAAMDEHGLPPGAAALWGAEPTHSITAVSLVTRSGLGAAKSNARTESQAAEGSEGGDGMLCARPPASPLPVPPPGSSGEAKHFVTISLAWSPETPLSLHPLQPRVAALLWGLWGAPPPPLPPLLKGLQSPLAPLTCRNRRCWEPSNSRGQGCGHMESPGRQRPHLHSE